MRIAFTAPVLIAGRRFDQGSTLDVSPEIGAPLVRAGVARDHDAPQRSAAGERDDRHDRNPKRKP